MTNPILVIGAGLSGLIAARDLAASGHQVRVVEQGRSVGGRLATRTIGGATLDHGAQFFTVRSDELATEVERWMDAGLASVWCEGFAEVDGYPRYRINGGMSRLAQHLATNLEVITGIRAQAIINEGDCWAVTYDGGAREPDLAAAVLATPPVPQTLELLSAGGVRLGADHVGLHDVNYHRVIALLVTSDAEARLPAPGALQRPDHPTFSFVADNLTKGISNRTGVTFHTAHALSAELWPLSDAEIRTRLMAEAAETIGLGASDLSEVQVKRWRYSGPVTPWADRCAVVRSAPGPLVLAGDAFGGPKMEGAYLSGRAAAEAIHVGLPG